MDEERFADPPALFHEVVFRIILSDQLPPTTVTKVREQLLAHGATESPPRTERITLDLTHIIAATSDFPGYTNAERLMIPVVTPEWVVFSLRKDRLAQIRPFTPDPRLLFSDILATVAERPSVGQEAICDGIVAMGGQFSNHLNKHTTHIVALNLDNEKCRQALAKKLDVKIVLPHWFDDCLKLGQRISERPYLLPDPEIEFIHSTAPLTMPPLAGPDMAYAHAHKIGQMNDPPRPPSRSEPVDIFGGKRVLLGQDLQLSDRRLRVLAAIVEQTGGRVAATVTAADVYVGQFRDGDDYVRASRCHTHVGNLTWLYWMFAHGKWTNPTNRLLHYPLVRGGMPEMRDKVIALSKYGGEARLYLQNLIEACGARFTRSMEPDTTHLITARVHSEKCMVAKERNIHMVNHLWIEDTYARWKVMTLTNLKYTHFPPRTNLQEVVGQTRIDLDALLPFYYHEADSPEPDVAAAAYNGGNGATNSMVSRQTVRTLGTPAPATRRTIKVEESPALPSTGSRKAKEMPSARLHEQATDSSGRSRKRPKSEDVSGGEDDGDDDGRRAHKKSKKRSKSAILLLITAWPDRPPKGEDEQEILSQLGIKCVDDPSQCNYLAAPALVRTENFCRAMARAPVIVNTTWVEACLHAERLVDAEPHLLKDLGGEGRPGVDLAACVARAKQNKEKLLAGQAVFCTPGVQCGYEACRRVVESNGGVCVLFEPQKKWANVRSAGDRLVLLSGDGSADRKLWPRFREMCRAWPSSAKEPMIYFSAWIADTAINQAVAWGDRYCCGGPAQPSGAE